MILEIPRGELLAAPTLSAAFYRQATVRVAKGLLGKILVRVPRRGMLLAAMITEVEAYLGASDPASHSFKGERLRNRSMFKVGGTSYVYLSYGINHCVNVVTGDEGVGEGVLLRAAMPLHGLEYMAKARGVVLDGSVRSLRKLLSGPGKLTQALSIDITDDGSNFFGAAMRLVDLGLSPKSRDIDATPRIGISKAKNELLRFAIADSPWLSR